MPINRLKSLLTIFCLILVCQISYACSMYKVTHNGSTMVGCNEDNWRTTSHIWFENPLTTGAFGAAFTGSRNVGANRYAPQSGMNTEGLVFSRLESWYPKKSVDLSNKKQITDEVIFLSEILHDYKTVAEVKRHIEQYDHSIFIDDVFIYIDKSGDYLVVEPYGFVEGDEAAYVLSNFCPSITNKETARTLIRYKNGEDYIKNHSVEASLTFCKNVSDTMHVCRNRNGDGTLLTSIWDTDNGTVNLYFYHDFDSTIQFSLSTELAKGDYQLYIPDLFPKNSEYQRLADYKTPFNTPWLRVSLVVLAGILFLSIVVFGFDYLRKLKTETLNVKKILLIGLNLLLVAYLFVLATNINIYYFDAPYTHYSSNLITASSYVPFILLLAIIPLFMYMARRLTQKSTALLEKGLIGANMVVYLVLVVGFNYWGLFTFIN